MIDFWKGLFGDVDGYPSSKRMVSVVLSLLLAVAFVANIFWDATVDDNILDAVMLVIISGLGLTGLEKFKPQLKDK